MKQLESKQIPLICRHVVLVVLVGILWSAPKISAQPVDLTPGVTKTIEITSSTENCSTAITGNPNQYTAWAPVADCVANPADATPLKVFALSAFSKRFDPLGGTFSSVQNLNSVAKLIQQITIPVPIKEPFLSTLRVQVGTEVVWSGGFIAAGAPSTYAEISATLQIRDITDGDAGPIVASNTFLNERFDSQLDLPDESGVAGLTEALNLVDAVDVSGSSGADVMAYLERGRTYTIELETRCDAVAPVIGFGICLFAADSASALGLSSSDTLYKMLSNDGFKVAPFEVTVESDPVEVMTR